MIVTGGIGGIGIGKALALAFTQQGYNVVVTGRNSVSGHSMNCLGAVEDIANGIV